MPDERETTLAPCPRCGLVHSPFVVCHEEEHQRVPQTTIHRLPDPATGAQPVLRPCGYPSDFGLANAITSLVRDYGRIGAINRLIEEAERLESGGDHMVAAMRRRRIESDRA